MRIYLADGTDEMAALQAARDAGYVGCALRHSDHLGSYLDAEGIGLAQELDLLAAVRCVDPSAGTSAFWMDDDLVPDHRRT